MRIISTKGVYSVNVSEATSCETTIILQFNSLAHPAKKLLSIQTVDYHLSWAMSVTVLTMFLKLSKIALLCLNIWKQIHFPCRFSTSYYYEQTQIKISNRSIMAIAHNVKHGKKYVFLHLMHCIMLKNINETRLKSKLLKINVFVRLRLQSSYKRFPRFALENESLCKIFKWLIWI